MIELWIEYESRETLESNYAYLVDRVVPLILNINNNGQSWIENSISYNQVIEKNSFIENLAPDLWAVLLEKLLNAKKKGWLS